MSVGIDEAGSHVQALSIDDTFCILVGVLADMDDPASGDANVSPISWFSRTINYGSIRDCNV
jgi:hypothetical protein